MSEKTIVYTVTSKDEAPGSTEPVKSEKMNFLPVLVLVVLAYLLVR